MAAERIVAVEDVEVEDAEEVDRLQRVVEEALVELLAVGLGAVVDGAFASRR